MLVPRETTPLRSTFTRGTTTEFPLRSTFTRGTTLTSPLRATLTMFFGDPLRTTYPFAFRPLLGVPDHPVKKGKRGDRVWGTSLPRCFNLGIGFFAVDDKSLAGK
jgi:hypothetical protein